MAPTLVVPVLFFLSDDNLTPNGPLFVQPPPDTPAAAVAHHDFLGLDSM